VVDDAAQDERVRSLPVREGLGIGSYVGVPLLGGDGTVAGALCAFDRCPAERDEAQVALLQVLARLVSHELERERDAAALRRSEAALADFFEQGAIPLHWVGADGTILRANRAELELLGYAREEYVGRHIAEFHADQDVIDDILRRLAAGETLRDYEARLRAKDGSIKYVVIDSSVRWEEDRFGHSRCFSRDVTARKQAEERAAEQARQQAAVAELGREALTAVDLDRLLQRAVATVATTLGVEYCEVLELAPDGRELRLRAGVGWREGLVGRATVGAGRDSQAGYTLLADGPVIVADLRTETRFHGPPLLHEHGVVGGLSTVVRGRERTFGVLGAHSRQRRHFTDDDVLFLRAVANILAAAIDRRRLETALADDRFRSLVQHAADAIVVVAADGTVRYVSPALERLLGYDPADLVGAARIEIVHPDDAGRVRELFLRVTGQPAATASTELRVRHRDGSWRWHEMVATNLLADPAVAGVVINARDVTERKAAAAELAGERDLLRSVMELLPDAVFVKDAAGRFVRINRAAASLYGCADPADAIGKTDFDFYPEALARGFAADERPVLERGEPLLNRLAQQAGEGEAARWTLASKVPLRDSAGQVVGLVGVTRDVTDLTRAEEELRRSEARFRSLIVNATDLISILDPDGTIRYESPASKRLLGYDPEALVGENGFALIHPDDRAAAWAAFAAAVADPGQVLTGEFRFRHADGSWRWLEATGTNLLADPAVAGFVVNAHDVTERKRTEEALRRSEAGLAEAQRLAGLGSWTYDLTTDELTWSAENRRLFGLAAEEPAPTWDRFLDLVDPVDRDAVQRAAAGAGVGAGRDGSVEFRVNLPDGGHRVLLGRIEAVRDEAGRPLRLRGTNHDVTEQRRAEEGVRASEARFRSLVVNALEIVLILDPTGAVRYQSPAVARVLGYGGDALLDVDLFTVIHPDDRARAWDLFAEVLAAPRSGVQAEVRFRHQDGSWRRLEGVATNLLDEPSVGGVVVNARDVTERRALEARLAHQASHDPLTDLPNRTLFGDRLAGAAAAARRRGSPLAVLFVDLDGFKLVNDSLGHVAGDELLVAVARRLRASLPAEALLARFGGDEFAVLLDGDVDRERALAAAEGVIEALRCPFTAGGRETFVTASVGVVHRTPRLVDPSDLLRDADTALYAAKAEGRGAVAFFEPRMRAPMLARLERETALRRAVERDELRLRFQPVVDLASGAPAGVEALVRWQHPELGLLGPADFIEIAEETGLIVPIGRWVIEAACREARRWRDAAPAAPPPVLGLNLSVRQLAQPDLPATLEAALAANGIAPDRLELEITESAVMGGAPEIGRTLRSLRRLGVRLAIDDFGTGYSSLARLRRLPLDGLKIDRCFVAGLGREAGDLAVVRAVTRLAHDLGLVVTAEGIETPEQAALARELGVDLGQGFAFARPLAGEAIPEFLRRGARPVAAAAAGGPNGRGDGLPVVG